MKWLILILTLMPAPIWGQLFPLSDFYVLNGLVINPAFAGSENALSINLQYRNQWAGFKEAPRSGFITAHTPFNYDRMGLGIMVNRNSFGIYNETSVMGNYAFRFNLYKGKMAFGLGFGIKSFHISWSDLNAADPDDFLLNNSSSGGISPDFSLGAFYETGKYFLGVSLPGFLNHQYDETSGKIKAKNQPDFYNYLLTGGYSFRISENLNFSPSLLLGYNSYTKMQGDFLLKADISNMITAGAGFRTSGMILGLLSCNINRQLSIYYSFDTDSGKTGHYRKGSHEIMIGYTFSYTRNVRSPAEI